MEYTCLVCFILIVIIAVMISIIIWEIGKRKSVEIEKDDLKAELRLREMCEKSASVILDTERNDRIIKNTHILNYDDLLNIAFEVSSEELLEEAKTNKELKDYLEGKINGN